MYLLENECTDRPAFFLSFFSFFSTNHLFSGHVQAIIKPQYVDHIPKAVKGKVGEIFTSKNQLGTMERVLGEVRSCYFRTAVGVKIQLHSVRFSRAVTGYSHNQKHIEKKTKLFIDKNRTNVPSWVTTAW